MDINNFKMLIPKEKINAAILKGIAECKELASKIECRTTTEFVKCIEKHFKEQNTDLYVGGIFMFFLSNEIGFRESINEITTISESMARILVNPILTALIEIDEPVFNDVWKDINKID